MRRRPAPDALTRALMSALLLVAAATTLAAQDVEVPRFRTVPWTVFAGAGTDFDSYSLNIGARRGAFGLGFGYRHDTETGIPAYSSDPAPAGSEEKSFPVTSVGLDLYTATQVADFLTGYAVIGGYVDINTVLARESESQTWHLSENSPDWTDARLAYGGGLEINPIEWLAVGLGYHSVRGFNLHLGYSW